MLKSKIEAVSDFLRSGKYFLIALTAPMTFNSKSFLKSSRLNVDIGLRLIEPGQ